MSDSLVVILEDRVAGTLARAGGGRLTFAYSEEYREREDATPLSLSMPTQIPDHSDRVVTAWLWGLLPDNDAVLRRWARGFQVSASSPFSLLGTPVGADCPGAVRFSKPEDIEHALARTGDVSWLTEEQVAERLRELRQDSTAWLGESFTGQFSLAGAQAKTALLQRDGNWGVPSGAAATTHILKPAVRGFDDHDLNEHLCLDAARRAGLTAARTQVASFAEQTAVVVTRYDRHLAAEDITRVHQEDLCQALAVPPARKYQNEGGPGVKEIAALLRRVMAPRVAQAAVWAFADALAWNWLIAGTDAHAKNYSLLLAANQVRLAPLYDIASALPYGMHERKLRMAMKIGGDYRLLPYDNRWPTAARDLGLDAGALVDRVLELADRAPDAFAEAAGTQDVRSLERELPDRLLELVAERAARCRRLLEGPSARDG
jgi:serine/threonine-protein kinase HipA